MSGRSAYVRAKKTEIADKAYRKQYPDCDHDDNVIYGFSGPPAPRPMMSMNSSFTSAPTPHPRRRQSVSSSAGSTYGTYPSHAPRKPRPIIIASAIEKSDFRTHLDGMSKSVRGKLGRLIKGGDDNTSHAQRRPATASESSDSGSRSTGFTPSLGAVPSLSPSSPKTEHPRSYSSHARPNHNQHHPRQQESMIHKIRRFEGGGKLPQLGWKSLSNNPELWDENGDTFVYMYMWGSRTKPPPSFRINSKVIYQSGATGLIRQLRDSSVPDGWPRFCPSDLPSPEDSNSPEDTVGSFDLPRQHFPRSATHSDLDEIESLRPHDITKRNVARAPRGIQHEIYIAWPGMESGNHSTIWHITTRNFFAIMYDANALVGTTLHEAIVKLFERVDMYPDYLDRSISRVAWITDYIVRHKFDDVRNNPSYAASLLAFSEMPRVRWREGYIEAFVHCVGMLNMGLQTIPEWHYITPHTKMFIENASLELEERVHQAQAWLLSFDFTEMWPTTSAPPSASRGCFDRFRKWLCKYYENAFLHWPPTNEQTWLTHDMVVRLRNDFYGLYDYLVDRDVIFDGTEYRPGQKWAITSKSGQPFRADSHDLSFTDILLGFDNRNGFPHMPHPYPVCPPSVPVSVRQKSAFTLKKPSSQAEIVAQSRRKALSYAEASNVYTLRDQYMHTDLVTNFIRFEQADMVESLDPYEARRGRWLLVYGVLQVLAIISVDSPNLRYREGVQYHISPQMKGIVPWADAGSPAEEEAEHKRSHCWIIPSTWAATAPKARPGTHKPIIWGQYGDGRVRGESTEKLSLGKVRDTSIGRKRAEEWVATNGGIHHLETDSASGGSTGPPIGSAKGRSNSAVSAGPVHSGSTEDGSTESQILAVRKKRAIVHGFTDFQVPSDW